MSGSSKDTEKEAGVELAALVPVLRDLVQALNRQIECFDRQFERENQLRAEQHAREDEIRAQAMAREDRIRDQAQDREDRLRDVIRAELAATAEWLETGAGHAVHLPPGQPRREETEERPES